MKFFALAALFAAVVSAYPQSAIPKNIQASHVHHVYTYTTLLDHFNPQNYVEVNFVSNPLNTEMIYSIFIKFYPHFRPSTTKRIISVRMDQSIFTFRITES